MKKVVLIVLGVAVILGFIGNMAEEESTANDFSTPSVEDADVVVNNEETVQTSMPYTEPTPIPTPSPTPYVETEEEYKASCQTFKYKDVLRNPEQYIGQRVAVAIKISTVHSTDIFTPIKYYMGYSESDYGWYGDRYGIFDYREDESLKLLSDDVIKVWGEISKPQETQSLILASEELFCIDMKYVELISE